MLTKNADKINVIFVQKTGDNLCNIAKCKNLTKRQGVWYTENKE